MSAPLDVGPGTPVGDLLRRSWQPIHRDVDLRPGTARPLTILGQSWTLFRTRDGRPGLLGAGCPHRGTALHLGRIGDDALACMHHGWSFGVDGRCRHRPDGGPLDVAAVRAAPVVSHLGLLFAWLGPGEPAALPRWPAFEAPGTLRVLPPEAWPCPFDLRLENSLDLAHLPTTHQASGVGALLGPPQAPTVTMLPDGLVVDGASDAPVPLRMRWLLPNALCFPTPVSESAGWRDHLVWRVPIDRDRCVSFTVTHVPADVPDHAAHAHDAPVADPFGPTRVAQLGAAVLRGQARLDDLGDQPNLTEVEDYVALCAVVRDADGAPADGERLGPHDGPVRALRQGLRDALAGRRQPWCGLPAADTDG